MKKRLLALRLDSLQMGPREAMGKAAALGMNGVEINGIIGDLTPKLLDRSGRKHLLHYLDDLGLGLASIAGDTGYSFDDENTLDLFLEQLKQIIELASDLHVTHITTAIGPVSNEPNELSKTRIEMMKEILADMGAFAANRGVCLAITAGFEKPEDLKGFLGSLNNDAVRVNYDPANMIFAGHDSCQAVEILSEYIVTVRARDGRRYLDGSGEELTLGEGDVPYDDIITLLDDIDFHGYFVLARFPQENIEEEIKSAKKFLNRYD